ncbi:cytochrome P450 3A56-like [Bradysia coprophila]|uniref:cytochrome P450 3A56-like n=1 Tax=Bradysia coprophila TaxID=38358 RepID=UPI00187DCE31|nr:cytochrome P450 3A56-like [Bradysia coprophila]
MFFLIVCGVLALLVGVISFLIIYARWNFGTLESMGIPTIKPHWLLGSHPNIHKIVVQDEDMKNFRKYGKIWGSYEGREPQIFLADAELVRLICVKDSDHFQDKRMIDFKNELFNEVIDTLPYEKWKAVRNEVSQPFSTKVKHMSDQMLESINDCTGHLKDICKKDPVIEVRKVFNALSIDITARCAFGTRVYNCIRDPNNEFVLNAKKIFSFIEDGPNIGLTLMLSFPFLLKIIPLVDLTATKFFQGILTDILKERRALGNSNNDFVDAINNMIRKSETDEEFKRLKITDLTAMAQAITFLTTGIETTSSTLTMILYQLATNPDKQKLLHEEVDRVLLQSKGAINHSIVGDLVYVNACIHEALRLAPTLTRIDRICTKEWENKEFQLKIPVGMSVQLPVWPLHYNPEYFPEPEKFQPDRFLPQNKDILQKYALLSFGQGPHNCVGTRFALETLKLSITAIARDFQFETCEDTKLVWKPAGILGAAYKPIKVKFVRRN